MGLISAFMFSDASEIDLLHAKITIEESLVDTWIIVEGRYTFRGVEKPLVLRELIKGDERFDAFLGRIHVIEIEENFLSNFKYNRKFLIRKKIEIFLRKLFFSGHQNQMRVFVERKYFYAENCSRNSAVTKILEVAKSDHDWILVSDVDEILNLQSQPIRDSIIKIMSAGDLFILLKRQKFAFDFDNLDPQPRFTPLISIKLLKNQNASLSEFRSRSDGVCQIQYPYVTEYTFCFNMKGVIRKYEMFPHISPSQKSLAEYLSVNAAPLYEDSRQSEITWYNKVDINDYHVPNFILQNIEKLRTHNIPTDYELNRRSKFPHLFA
jgi:hypothetical protein